MERILAISKLEGILYDIFTILPTQKTNLQSNDRYLCPPHHTGKKTQTGILKVYFRLKHIKCSYHFMSDKVDDLSWDCAKNVIPRYPALDLLIPSAQLFF